MALHSAATTPHPTTTATPTSTSTATITGLPGSGEPTTTSPQGPYLANPLPNGTCTCEVQTDLSFGSELWFPTFSPKTCLELLPSLTREQIKHEVEYHTSLGRDLGVTTRTAQIHQTDAIHNCLQDEALFSLENFASSLANYDQLIYSFSGTLEKAKQYIEELTADRQQRPAPTTPDGQAAFSSPLNNNTSATAQQVAQTPAKTLPRPVRCLKLDLTNIDWKDVCQGVRFISINSRQVAYMGKREYRYGKIVHRPAEYPDNQALDDIITAIASEMNDPSFNKDNWTCLITIYADGTCYIPYHSDNEHSINPNSDIVTVNLGETRKLEFRSKVGPVIHESLELHNGTVYTMSRESQNFWEHSIPIDESVTGTRVSLTFRRLDTPSPPRNRIPPIHESTRPKEDSTPIPPERVLFLTDSLHKELPSTMFPKHLPCVKEKLFELSRLGDYEHMFPNTSYVIISAGINDLSRYDHRAYSLKRLIGNMLSYFCQKYPDTTFILHSLLLTRFEWLNHEVSEINRAFLTLSVQIRNLWLFDSHHICMQLRDRGVLILDPPGNGIHLSSVVRVEIAQCLTACIRELHARSGSIRRLWPIRRGYASILSQV